MNNTFSKDILIIGLGAQAKAWALNLRDSKRDITIALRAESKSLSVAKELGFKTIFIDSSEISNFKNILLLAPDDQHVSILKDLSDRLQNKQNIFYAHGFSVTYEKLNEIYPTLNHLLLAPKAIASEVRYNYETKSPLTAVVSTEYSDKNGSDDLKSLAQDLGITVGPINSSFLEETNADLFSEQSILCSLIPYGAKNSFDILTAKGISPEIAYIECWHEVKLIADAMIKLGPTEFFKLISPNALLGGQIAKDKIFNANLLKTYEDLYSNIESGKFFHATKESDFQKLQTDVLNEWENHPINTIYKDLGSRLRPKT